MGCRGGLWPRQVAVHPVRNLRVQQVSEVVPRKDRVGQGRALGAGAGGAPPPPAEAERPQLELLLAQHWAEPPRALPVSSGRGVRSQDGAVLGTVHLALAPPHCPCFLPLPQSQPAQWQE